MIKNRKDILLREQEYDSHNVLKNVNKVAKVEKKT